MVGGEEKKTRAAVDCAECLWDEAAADGAHILVEALALELRRREVDAAYLTPVAKHTIRQ